MEKSTKRFVGCDLQISPFYLFNEAAQMLIHAKEYNGMYFQIISPPHYITTTHQPIIDYDNLKPVNVVREGKNGKRHKKASLGKFASERGL